MPYISVLGKAQEDYQTAKQNIKHFLKVVISNL